MADQLESGGQRGAGVVEQECAEEGFGYLARQPIFNRRGVVFGYELSFHGLLDEPDVGGLSTETRGVLDAVAVFGVERYTHGAWAFVKCNADALASDVFHALPPALTVVQIPAVPDPSDALIRDCAGLRECGFRIALSGWEWSEVNPLLPFAEFVKVNVRVMNSPEWGRIRNGIQRFGGHIVAEDVNGHAAYVRAGAEGAEYLQGFYFCHPELIPNGRLPADRLLQLQILHELFKDPLDLRTLSPLVRRDPSLVYRVLRIANSPMCAIRSAVTSIESAIMILGDGVFRRIATLAIQCGLTREGSTELLKMALVRAKFCAGAAPLCGLNPDEMYLLGMLSLLPAMLHVPMQSILPNLPLRMELREALFGVPLKERCLLSWLEDLEMDNISGCETTAAAFGLNRRKLAQIYLKALEDGPREAETVH